MRKALEQMPRVVVVDGGFCGTHAAHTLRNAPVRVTVIDRTNHSIFHPLLYQVASAGPDQHESQQRELIVSASISNSACRSRPQT